MNLVTGATGHIGNVLVRELIKRGEKVRALVLPGEDLAPLNDLPIEIAYGDVLDKESLLKAFQGVEYVFHLAGIISIVPSEEFTVHAVNVEGTRNMLDAASKSLINRFIYTSSIHAFKRIPHGSTIDETTPIDPTTSIGSYDRSKAEATLEVLSRTKEGFPAVIACPTGVVGPYDFKKSEMGELVYDWFRHKVNYMIDGSYDFVDVRDVVSGLILARDKGKIGQLYILSGELIRISDMWALVQELFSLRSRLINIPTQLAKFAAIFTQIYYRISKTKPKFTNYSIETLHSNAVISNQKARTHLGYSPRRLKDSIRDTIDWWKNQMAHTVKESNHRH